MQRLPEICSKTCILEVTNMHQAFTYKHNQQLSNAPQQDSQILSPRHTETPLNHDWPYVVINPADSDSRKLFDSSSLLLPRNTLPVTPDMAICGAVKKLQSQSHAGCRDTATNHSTMQCRGYLWVQMLGTMLGTEEL